MKRIILTFSSIVLFGSLLAGPANAVSDNTFPLCSVDSSKACVVSLSVRGAGISDWVEISNPTSINDPASPGTTHLFDTAGSAYSPAAGYGTVVKLKASGITDGEYYGVSLSSSNGTSAAQAYGTYEKHLDPRTELKVVLNTKSLNTKAMLSSNLSNGSDRSFSTSGNDNILTITSKVALQATSTAGNMGNWDAPASNVRDGVAELRGMVASPFPGNGMRIWDGMAIDSNGSTVSAPFITNTVYFDGFNVMLKAPHTLTDGTTLNTGFYSSTIPTAFLSMVGLTQQQVLTFGVSLTADYTDGRGAPTQIQAVVESASDGAVKISSVGLHYSAPTMGTKFTGIPQTAAVGALVKKGKKVSLPLKSTQEIALTWKSTSPKICKVTATKKTTKKKVGKKTVKTVTITKWQVQGKKKGTCTVVGTNAGNGSFGPASISKTIIVR